MARWSPGGAQHGHSRVLSGRDDGRYYGSIDLAVPAVPYGSIPLFVLYELLVQISTRL